MMSDLSLSVVAHAQLLPELNNPDVLPVRPSATWSGLWR